MMDSRRTQYVVWNMEQGLSDSEKLQARNNIGAAAAYDVVTLRNDVDALSNVSVYTTKGEATVAELNAGPAGIQAGWAYQLTDSGTLTDGNIAVVAGDSVAWDGTKWFPLVKSDYYATKTYAQNVAHSIAPDFDPTRDEDHKYIAGESVIYTDGKTHTFLVDHYGAWKADDVIRSDTNSFVNAVNSKILSYKSFKDVFVAGTITTNVAVGSVVNLTINSSSSYHCAIVDCAEFDKFIFSGVGGSSPRLWCFVDADNKVIRKAESDSHFDTATRLVAPPGSKKLIINCANASYNSGEYLCETKIIDKVELDEMKLKKQDALISFKGEFVVGNIYTNGAVGSVVNLTVNDSSGWRCAVVDCSYLDSFKIKGEGGDNPRLWCFIDADNKIISKAVASLNPQTAITLVAPLGAKKIIVNVTSASYNSSGSVFDRPCYAQEILSIAESNESRLDALKNFKPVFNFTLEPQNFAEDISDMDFTESGVKLMLEQVYTKFEALITDFPDLITKYDAASVAGESYPDYANGVGSSNPDYLETPAYKTYMYKVSNVNVGAGNSGRFVKKKMFIVAGQHGWEAAAPFNTYLLAKKLCDATEQAAFAILANFDVYIIPCLNGYGLYHHQRCNANGVDINRNYPTPRWTESGSGTENWTGPSAGSEFETKVVMGCVESIGADIFVDHHNYDYGEYQFYSSTCDEGYLQDVYNSLVNLSSHFIRLLPSYFGSFFRLLQLATSTDSPRNANVGKGNAKTWAFSSLNIPAFTIEICKRINYVGGLYSSAAGDYSNDAWKVGYMTLSEQLMRYGLKCF